MARSLDEEASLKRALMIILWMAVLAFLLFIARGPLQRLHAVVRLWRGELRPPLLVPVAGVRRTSLSDSWGAARGAGRKHEGIDIFAPCGRPVLSATEGFVMSVGDNNLGGHVVWILGPGGTWHYYAHLSRFANLRRWDYVQIGDTVGYVGDTGNAKGGPCHLHYGIYRGGVAHNPYPYLVPSSGKSRSKVRQTLTGKMVSASLDGGTATLKRDGPPQYTGPWGVVPEKGVTSWLKTHIRI